jgi:hypothetical protein
MKMENNINLTQSLRELTVGAELAVPIERKSSLSTTIYSHLAPERAKGYRYRTRTDYVKNVVIVTRVA